MKYFICAKKEAVIYCHAEEKVTMQSNRRQYNNLPGAIFLGDYEGNFDHNFCPVY